jgi:hypothetical protein
VGYCPVSAFSLLYEKTYDQSETNPPTPECHNRDCSSLSSVLARADFAAGVDSSAGACLNWAISTKLIAFKNRTAFVGE